MNEMEAFAQARTLYFPKVKELCVFLIGVGGTGSWLAPHVARIARLMSEKDEQKVSLFFIDPDRVEAKNIYRQSFANAEIGANKAEALAYRCTAAWGVPVKAFPAPFKAEMISGYEYTRQPWVLIGCVDNWAARLEISKAAKSSSSWAPRWWLDCGNSKNSGQILLGRSDIQKGEIPFGIEGKCTWLPLPHIQSPDLLHNEPTERPVADPINLSCADLALLDAQGLGINARMAAEAADMLLRMLVTGDLRRYQAHLNLMAGSTRSRYIVQEEIQTYLPQG